MGNNTQGNFTVRRLLFLTTAIAIVCALLSSIRMPEFMRAALIVILAVEVVYAVFRWPVIRADVLDLRRRRQQLVENRQKLAEEVLRRKQLARKTPPATNADAERDSP